jgi:hypothetical protein
VNVKAAIVAVDLFTFVLPPYFTWSGWLNRHPPVQMGTLWKYSGEIKIPRMGGRNDCADKILSERARHELIVRNQLAQWSNSLTAQPTRSCDDR